MGHHELLPVRSEVCKARLVALARERLEGTEEEALGQDPLRAVRPVAPSVEVVQKVHARRELDLSPLGVQETRRPLDLLKGCGAPQQIGEALGVVPRE